MLVAKAPKLYGFRDLVPLSPLEYESIAVPGGTDLQSLSEYIGVDHELRHEGRGLIEDEVQLHANDARGMFGPFDVAGHPIQRVGDAGKHVSR